MAPSSDSSLTKTCKFCGETILAVAKKCKYCKSMLDGSPPKQEEPSVVEKSVDPVIVCPKCGCNQFTTQKKGVGFLRAGATGVAAALVLGAVAPLAGLAAGAVAGGLKGRNNIRITCLKCGHSWIAGK